jgi:hypothetical protein
VTGPVICGYKDGVGVGATVTTTGTGSTVPGCHIGDKTHMPMVITPTQARIMIKIPAIVDVSNVILSGSIRHLACVLALEINISYLGECLERSTERTSENT